MWKHFINCKSVDLKSKIIIYTKYGDYLTHNFNLFHFQTPINKTLYLIMLLPKIKYIVRRTVIHCSSHHYQTNNKNTKALEFMELKIICSTTLILLFFFNV